MGISVAEPQGASSCQYPTCREFLSPSPGLPVKLRQSLGQLSFYSAAPESPPSSCVCTHEMK